MWRLLRGKPAQALPAHYRLDCDYGTALIAIYNEGEGDNPIYLCERHATEMTLDGGCGCDVGVRLIERNAVETELASGIDPTKDQARNHDDQVQSGRAQESPIEIAHTAGPKPKLSDRRQAVDIPAPTPSAPAAPEAVLDGPSKVGGQDVAPGKMGPIAGPAAPPLEAPRAKVPPAKSATAKTARVKAATAKGAQAKGDSSSKGSTRELTYGNPAKALVDETIWNLATGDYQAYRTALREGKSAMGAAQAAGGQLEVVHRKIQEYTARIEALLGGSQATVRVDQAVHSVLEREMLTIIGNEAMSESEKDAAVAHLGAFQEWMNRELPGKATALEAHRLAVAIGERANWGAASCRVPSELRPVYRAVYRSVRDAVRAAAIDVQELGERLANLYAAKSDLDAAAENQAPAPADLRVAASPDGSGQEQRFAEL